MGCSATKIHVRNSSVTKNSAHRGNSGKGALASSKPQYIFQPSQVTTQDEIKLIGRSRSPSIISVESASSHECIPQCAALKGDDARSDVPSCGSLADVAEFHDLGVIQTFTPECTSALRKSHKIDERQHPFMVGIGRECATDSPSSPRMQELDSPSGSDTDSVLKFCSFVPHLA